MLLIMMSNHDYSMSLGEREKKEEESETESTKNELLVDVLLRCL